jgi:hypothetical protein
MSAGRAGGNDGMGLLLCLCNSGTGLLFIHDGPREGLLKPATITGKIQTNILEETEMKTTVWLSSSILSGIGWGRVGDGNEDDCVVDLFDTLWNWVWRSSRKRGNGDECVDVLFDTFWDWVGRSSRRK